MDRLETMFKMQDKLQERLCTWTKIVAAENPDAAKQQFINQMILALVEESVEIMRETAYKSPAYVPFGWKQGQQYNREACLEECVDLWHFLMNIVLANGFTADEFYGTYCKKNGINHIRQDEGY
jgi:dimeric dUTPase (all-alpha-NTP-PPase superfamily)